MRILRNIVMIKVNNSINNINNHQNHQNHHNILMIPDIKQST